MACNPQRRRLSQATARTAGFTLIELSVVILIVGILSSIGLVNFMRFRSRASYSSCVTNQRHILEATLLYIGTANPGTTNFDVNFLTGAGFVSNAVAKCPTSTTVDFNDYHIDIVDDHVTVITCKNEPALHTWPLP